MRSCDCNPETGREAEVLTAMELERRFGFLRRFQLLSQSHDHYKYNVGLDLFRGP